MAAVKKKGYKRFLRLLFVTLPLCLGFIGYMGYYTEPMVSPLTAPVLSALFSAIRLFTLATDLSFKDGMHSGTWYCWLIELSRYAAMGVTGTALFKLLKPFLSSLIIQIRLMNKDAIVVHGSPRLKEIIASNIHDKRIIIQDDSPPSFKARRQIIAFESDAEVYGFMNEHISSFPFMRHDHKEQTRRDRVYLCLLSANQSSYGGQNFSISHMAENCSRRYWSQHYLHRFGEGCAQQPGRQTDKRDSIVLIGFGQYGSELLTQALLVNVFLPGTPGVAYHVFGDGDHYRKRHSKLEKFLSFDENAPSSKDVLLFYAQDQWDDHLDILKAAERIIIATDDDVTNMRIFSDLKLVLPHSPKVYLRLHQVEIMDLLYRGLIEKEALPAIFGTDAELYNHEIIIDESLLERAKMIHSAYIRTADRDCVCTQCTRSKRECVRKCPRFVGKWEAIGGFKQASNIASADHLDVKLRQLLGQDRALEKDVPDKDRLDKNSLDAYRKKYDEVKIREFTDSASVLASSFRPYLEMEHNRWARYLYYWGWDYGKGVGGKSDDPSRKLHSLLIPFDRLDVQTMEYDHGAYDTLYNIDH